MRVLVTGGAGFIGSHLTERLLKDGHQVRVLDNLSSGRRQNLEHLLPEIEFTEGDIRDTAILEQLAQGCEWIFHQAAVVSVPRSIEHPQESHDVNIQGTFNVLQAARSRGVRRVMFACSAAIYGEDPRLPKHEDLAPAPISPYGVEKITGEYYLQTFCKLYGVETVSLRYFNVFGPRQDPSSPYSGVISIFFDRLFRGAQPTIFGDGEQYRDFIFVENVVEANMLAATTTAAAGRCYNIGCGQKTSLNDLTRLLSKISGRSFAPQYAPVRAGDIRESVADISRAQNDLGFKPKISVEEGLRRLYEYEKARRQS